MIKIITMIMASLKHVAMKKDEDLKSFSSHTLLNS